MKLPIHTAVITRPEGTTLYVSATRRDLIARIGDYCREHWSSVSSGPPQEEDRDLIDAYFFEHPEDSLTVTERSIDLPEPYASAPKLLDQLASILSALAAYQTGNGDAYTALCGEIANASAIIANASTPSVPRFTVFCREADSSGTIHIDSVKAADLESAILAGKQQCIDDWSDRTSEAESPWTMETIHCLGVAAGDVEILHWQDQPE
jgi:hypothetical protein